jgi:hypothetical protein
LATIELTRCAVAIALRADGSDTSAFSSLQKTHVEEQPEIFDTAAEAKLDSRDRYVVKATLIVQSELAAFEVLNTNTHQLLCQWMMCRYSQAQRHARRVAGRCHHNAHHGAFIIANDLDDLIDPEPSHGCLEARPT